MLGLVGESGSGKSMTGFSIIGPGRPARAASSPGRSCSRARTCARLRRAELRALRGNRIAMIFQDPMMTLNPVLRIDTQMIEAMLAHHDGLARARRASARARRWRGSASRRPTSGSRPIRTSSPAACASASRSRSRCSTSPTSIIADEPTTALDVTIQGQILYEVQKLCRETRHRR